MKKLGLYQVYDNVAGECITGIIPATNNLTAALGFRNAYIKEKDPVKNPYQYKALELRKVAVLDLDDNGLVKNVMNDTWSKEGGSIMNFISEEMQARGVDDFIVDDDVEEK